MAFVNTANHIFGTKGSQFTDYGSLPQLENLLNEFFLLTTTNDRKREIETMLSEFSATPNSWQTSFVYLQQTENEYTKMYCLTVMETFVNQRWHTASAEIRVNFATSVWKFLLDHHQHLSNPILNKLCKINATVSSYIFPDLITRTIDLINCKFTNDVEVNQSIMFGLKVLGAILEDQTTVTFLHHSSAKVEMTKMIEPYLVSIIQSITTLIESIIHYQMKFASGTPPPSPTNSPVSVFNSSKSLIVINCSPISLSLL